MSHFQARIQEAELDISKEKQQLLTQDDVGAVVDFTGYVRADKSDQGDVDGLFLEHYPGMAEKAILAIIDKAQQTWSLKAVSVVHRVGHLAVGDPIVYVLVASSHRNDAFRCAEFIMDYLKNDVPIWKKHKIGDKSHWVDQKTSDVAAKKTWD